MICDTEEDVVAHWSSSPILSKLLKTNYIQYKCCSHRCIDCSMNKMKRKSFNLRSQVWLYIVKHLFKLSIWIFGDNPKSINSWLYVLSTYCRWLFKVHWFSNSSFNNYCKTHGIYHKFFWTKWTNKEKAWSPNLHNKVHFLTI